MRTLVTVTFIGLILIPAAGCGSGGGGGGGPVLDVGYVKSAGSTVTDRAFSVATFADGSCVVTGAFGGTCTWGTGEAGETMLTTAGDLDIFVARYNPDGTLAWVKQAGGALVDGGLGIDTVPDGSCIVTGVFEDIATFGPGETNVTMLDDVDDQGDVFVARYNPDGTLAWAKRAGRNFSDRGRAVSAHADGSCIVVGTYNTIATFGPGETNTTTLTAVGSTDIFVAAYHPSGALAWARSAGGANQDDGADVEILADGSSLVTGFYQAPTATFGQGDPNQITMASAGIFDAFVARYNPDGTIAWVRSAGGPSFDEPSTISVFPDEGFVIGGFFRETAIFGPGEAGQTALTSLSFSNDYFVARYAPDGSLIWAKSGGGGAHEDTIRQVVARPDGSCVAVGHFRDIAVFDQGGPGQAFRIATGGVDAFVARFGADGRISWVRTLGGRDSDRGYGVAAYADGSFAACGEFESPAALDLGFPGEAPIFGPGGADMFLVRYNADGSL